MAAKIMDMTAMLNDVRTIAVVGFSTNPDKAGHYVPMYLRNAGFRIIPVNPSVTEAWGERGYTGLRDITEPVDLVLVFRRSEYAADVVRDALAMPHLPRIIWLQQGIESPEARGLAEDAGLRYIENTCLMVVHRLYVATPEPS